QPVYVGSGDAIVAKFDPKKSGAASLVYSTYLGGTSSDIAGGVAADSQGNTYVTGQTSSSDFPTLNAIQAARNGLSDVFVTEINPIGTALVYSTFLGGSSAELGDSVAVAQNGTAY